MILPLPRLYSAVSVRMRPVVVALPVPPLSLIPLPIGIAHHALPVLLPVLIHLALIPATQTTLLGSFLVDHDLRGRSAHITSTTTAADSTTGR